MINFDAGKLTSKITIQRDCGKTRDAHGQPVENWEQFHECWAQIKPTSGRERYIDQQLLAEATHEVAIRYKAGITPKMRVLYGSRIFDITVVHDIEERHVEMRLICKELV
jgi:SPP1 family predicted phage head-tail adaptor